MTYPAPHIIRVDVATDFLDGQSEPERDRYVFSYTITISNVGNVPAKLLTRHWLITDANGNVQWWNYWGGLYFDILTDVLEVTN